MQHNQPCLPKKFIIVSKSQLRYNSPICPLERSDRFNIRTRLCPLHDVYNIAVCTKTPSCSSSLSSCFTSIAIAYEHITFNLFHYPNNELISVKKENGHFSNIE